MVHKRYVKRGNKIYGPYFYKSVRCGDKVRNIYLGTAEKPTEGEWVFLPTIVFVLGFFFLSNVLNSIMPTQNHLVTGFVVREKPLEINIKELKSINLHPGERCYIKVVSNIDGAKFFTTSKLLKIDRNGIINFVPNESDIGRYLTLIFAESGKKFEYAIIEVNINKNEKK